MTLNTPIEDRDLGKETPHSPRERFGGFAIIGRTIDKCRAGINGHLGEYHYDCPLDNQLFSFKGINGAQFKEVVASAKTYEEVAAWLQAHGTPKTIAQIKEWSDKAEATLLKDIPTMQSGKMHKEVKASCDKLGLEFETATLFDWLEADDEATFHAHAH